MNKRLALALFLLALTGCDDPCNGTCGPQQICTQGEGRNLLQYIGGSPNRASWYCQTTGPLAVSIPDGGLRFVEIDAGCAPPGDDLCQVCLYGSCCGEVLACLTDATCAAASPASDPAVAALVTCAADNCAAACPAADAGVP